MIVELKKVKITKSIFNQLLSPALTSLETLNKYQVLGWVYDKGRFILLYDPDTTSLVKMSSISEENIDFRTPNIVYYMARGMVMSVQLKGMNEAIRWIERITEIQIEARVKGQLFI